MTAICQNFQTNYQSNNYIYFPDFLSGVKFAYVALSDDDVADITAGQLSGNAQAILGIIDYLEDIGFSNVQWGPFGNPPQYSSSICDLVIVAPSWGYVNSTYTDITLNFISCNGDVFRFVSEKNIWVTGYTDISTAFHNKCMAMYGYKKNYYSDQRLNLTTEMTEWTESTLKTHFQKNGVDPIEGIYESAIGTEAMPKYKLGLIKTVEGYNFIYLSGAKNYSDWTEGEIKANLYPTATATLFKADWKMGNKTVNDNAYISFEKGMMKLMIQGKDETIYIKLYPAASDGVSSINNSPSSGSGFAISTDGLIATNSHVILGATSIKVRGINGDFSKAYNAKVITIDKNNDLAIIKIEDLNFTSISQIPYIISNNITDVGTSVFVLGFPLTATMGDEIKLTNGIISSKTGFQGDVTSYQLSAPVQPGNSGGPLFDDKGNLIGIVNAKHLDAENVTYAVKANYLLNLISILQTPPKLPTSSILNGKTLSEQVKILQNFTYIIEIN